MCGIFIARDEALVREQLAAMVHRGPDSRHVRSANGLHVGFNRLAIIDTKEPEAEQPYISRKGRVVVFNGEIYNYRQLDPSAKSEVALIADMLDEGADPRTFFDGDYAIVYYNPSQDTVTMYRDRFGVCPLYWQRYPFMVSSESRRLAHPIEVPAHGKVKVILSDEGSEGYGVDVIPHYGVTSQRVETASFIDVLTDAVISRALHSDSGFAISLSGGLDSSLIALLLNFAGLKPTVALTSFFSEDSEDLKAARILAERLSCPHRTFQVGIESQVENKEILEHLDSPIGPTALKWRGGLRTWSVAKYAGPTKVVLCGDGADELLAGYFHHHVDATPYKIARRCLTSVRSMPRVNLDRTNKLGMAHSKEFRSPFLASTISYMLLSHTREPNKPLFRKMLQALGAPSEVYERTKYSPDELAVQEVPV